jgi:hypothetical protein
MQQNIYPTPVTKPKREIHLEENRNADRNIEAQ